MAQHKWHKEIKAWADGAEIESSDIYIDRQMWKEVSIPCWDNDRYLFRIKPQPKEPDFDATEYQKALKKSAQKFKEKIERTYAEVLDKAINELAQPKEPQYLYVYRMAGQHNVEFRFWDTKTDAPTYVGKIKLEVDDDM